MDIVSVVMLIGGVVINGCTLSLNHETMIHCYNRLIAIMYTYLARFKENLRQVNSIFV